MTKVTSMGRAQTTWDILRALFARSGNQCQFPGCTQHLLTEQNIFIGQVCHINAARKNGPRYRPEQDDDERRSYDNLILLCYPHHKEVDAYPDKYTADLLHQYKLEHEARLAGAVYAIDENALRKIAEEVEREYWEDIAKIHSFEHICPDLAVEINAKATLEALFTQLKVELQLLLKCTDDLRKWDIDLNQEIRDFLSNRKIDLELYDSVPYYKNPFINRNWEWHNLAIRNIFTRLDVLINQIEVRSLEMQVRLSPEDNKLSEKLEAQREAMRIIARSAGLAD